MYHTALILQLVLRSHRSQAVLLKKPYSGAAMRKVFDQHFYPVSLDKIIPLT
jgi:hypothetical protein